jgi:protein CpxP
VLRARWGYRQKYNANRRLSKTGPLNPARGSASKVGTKHLSNAMKRFSFLLVAGLLSLSAAAQDNRRGTPDQRAARQTEQLTQQLGLNADQQRQLQALNLRRTRQIDSLRAGGERPGPGGMRAVQQGYEANLRTLLTPDQWGTYERLRAERQEQLRDRRGNRPGGGRRR